MPASETKNEAPLNDVTTFHDSNEKSLKLRLEKFYLPNFLLLKM